MIKVAACSCTGFEHAVGKITFHDGERSVTVSGR
jgi:hypothetical protein